MSAISRPGQAPALACLAASLWLGGCSLLSLVGLGGDDEPTVAPPPPPPVPLAQQPWSLTLELVAAPELNPDARARPSPIRVHVFLAEPAADPSRLPFEDVFGGAAEPGPQATFTLRPGTITRVALDGVRSRTRLSVAAAFRDPSSSVWMDTRVLRPAEDEDVRLSAFIGADRVAIESP